MQWQLTELGFEIGRIRNKFALDNPQRKAYLGTVPASWVEKGYVQEVPVKE